MVKRRVGALVLLVAGVFTMGEALRAVAQTTKAPPAAASGKAVHAATAPSAAQPDDSAEGQRIFNQNCSRCHSVPMGFSPRIAGTVARHMRVRAGLSAHDYEALLKFLNP